MAKEPDRAEAEPACGKHLLKLTKWKIAEGTTKSLVFSACDSVAQTAMDDCKVTHEMGRSYQAPTKQKATLSSANIRILSWNPPPGLQSY